MKDILIIENRLHNFVLKIETIKNGQIAREFSGKADDGHNNNNKNQMMPRDFLPPQEKAFQ